MLRVGLTGGIGSGKSTVAEALVGRGAALVDGDLIAREIVEPGGPAFALVVERFGPAVVDSEGRIDRPALAAIVFADADARRDLNAITHPLIGATMLERVAAWEGTDRIVVLDVPLLTAGTVAFYRLDTVVVVDVPEPVAVARLVEHRGFAEDDARARIAAQIGRAERVAFADLVVDNAGTRRDLDDRIDGVWSELQRRASERT